MSEATARDLIRAATIRFVRERQAQRDGEEYARLERDVAASDGPKPSLDDWLGAADEENRDVPQHDLERVKYIGLFDEGRALGRAIEAETLAEEAANVGLSVEALLAQKAEATRAAEAATEARIAEFEARCAAYVPARENGYYWVRRNNPLYADDDALIGRWYNGYFSGSWDFGDCGYDDSEVTILSERLIPPD